MSSSPLRPGASHGEELEYYKKQYEQLETDLAEFQASSKELEEQLERDIENAEKNERKLKEQVEKLNFEVEEWRTKHNKAKTESNSAQNSLQKEITTMRDANRTLQLRLRDTEVMNDDYERQARNTESSLEDMESKYNVAIERGVLLEEEVKHSEQDREALRIEAQRLRDELGDLKVENEITLEKLRLADETIERLRSRKPSPLAVESLRARSPGSEASGVTPYSPTASTPPPKSDSASEAPTPPSPPLSDAPANVPAEPKTPVPTKRQSIGRETTATPRPGAHGPRTIPRHSRGPSMASSNSTTTSDAKMARPPTVRPRPAPKSSYNTSEGLPRSESLHQIRNLRGRMQKIEERVHSARSKLPAPQNRTPRGSPRTSTITNDVLPSSVTMRRTSKRAGSGMASQSEAQSLDGAVASDTSSSRRDSTAKRLSYGIPRPRSSLSERPSSALDRPTSAAAVGRPSSRTSLAGAGTNRPSSRTGARTPSGIPGRPGSSVAGNFPSVHSTPRSHRTSASIGELRKMAEEGGDGTASSTSRRTTMEHQPPSSVKRSSTSGGGSFLPHASTSKIGRGGRTSAAAVGATEPDDRGGGFSRATASSSNKMMLPPPPRQKASDLGETY